MLWSNNPSPSVLFLEQESDPDTPAATYQRLFIRETDRHLCRIDEDGLITDLDAIGQILAADPASPANGTFWVTDDGGSPAAIKLRFRKGGVSYTLAEVTV